MLEQISEADLNGREIVAVILSGGSGSRLWPLSRSMYPKQFLPLSHPTQSMLQQTLERAFSLPGCQNAIIVCNEEHRFLVGEQCQGVAGEITILLEPEGRNTAPAIALAALQATKQDSLQGDPLLLVMPADHVMEQPLGFLKAVELAKGLALTGSLVTFGVVPDKPETGYGYIKAAEKAGGKYFDVDEFVEKPSYDLACEYLSSGEYYWNGGIFMFKSSSYLNELAQYQPTVASACQSAFHGLKRDLDFLRADPESFSQSPSISIDYAVMEKSDLVKMVALDAGWNDVGSWSALWEVSDKDSLGNVSQGDVLLVDTKNSHFYSEDTLVTALGVENLVVVNTKNALLITTHERAQDVKQIVEKVEAIKHEHTQHHRKVYRPWGWYDSIDVGDRFQVKRIQVKPGAKLSVQMHHHRAEHWVVVKGQAEVLNGEQTLILEENQSTYIPIGAKHSLANPSPDQPLEIIEVQSGSYLGEDDIVRFEDQYGRAPSSES